MNNNAKNAELDFEDIDAPFIVSGEDDTYINIRRFIELRKKYGLSRAEGIDVLEKYATLEEMKDLCRRIDEPSE